MTAMGKLQHKETRNVMKQEIQFLITYKEMYHDDAFTTFEHLCKLSANPETENATRGVK